MGSYVVDLEKQKHLKWAWANMKRRCNKPTKDAHRYIGRGITYDPKWESLVGFNTDMASTYGPGLSLDRINNDEGYSADNCRWATAKDQANNTGRNRFFTINGTTKTFAQWIDTVPTKSSTVRQRFYGLNWNIEKSLFTPTHKNNKKVRIAP